jgi:hypothetical protein
MVDELAHRLGRSVVPEPVRAAVARAASTFCRRLARTFARIARLSST